jgi:hypothetical protein
MILILELSPAEQETLLELLAYARDEGPPGFEWQSKQLARLRHKVEAQIREQQRDPDLR